MLISLRRTYCWQLRRRNVARQLNLRGSPWREVLDVEACVRLQCRLTIARRLFLSNYSRDLSGPLPRVGINSFLKVRALNTGAGTKPRSERG